MGWFTDIFKQPSDEMYRRIEPRVTEYPDFNSMMQSYDGFGWAGHGWIDFGVDGTGAVERVLAMSPAQLFAEQHQLRQVTTFIARNVAQLGLHTFRRLGDNDRKRDRKNDFAKTLIYGPDLRVTDYELIYDLVMDFLLYDRAVWLVTRTVDRRAPWQFRRIPSPWVTTVYKNPWEVDYYQVSNGKDNLKIPVENIMEFTGYSPAHPSEGSPTIQGLRAILAEQLASQEYRGQVWERGGRLSSVLLRPEGAPRWSSEARAQFKSDWKDYTAHGPAAGGTPILEDGMDIKNVDFSAREQQFIEGATLSLAQVAGAFHINPTMVGQTAGATYSNVKEFRRMLYGDSLGPLLAQIEARINQVLFPMIGVDPDKVYAEFNIEEKLKGSFEEQAQAMSTSIGAPWMTRNEGRKLVNLPALPEGDELITPLNVLVGGQASPQDSGTQNESETDPVNPPSEFH